MESLWCGIKKLNKKKYKKKLKQKNTNSFDTQCVSCRSLHKLTLESSANTVLCLDQPVEGHTQSLTNTFLFILLHTQSLTNSFFILSYCSRVLTTTTSDLNDVNLINKLKDNQSMKWLKSWFQHHRDLTKPYIFNSSVILTTKYLQPISHRSFHRKQLSLTRKPR